MKTKSPKKMTADDAEPQYIPTDNNDHDSEELPSFEEDDDLQVCEE